jgi:hypothetical protein
MAGEPAKEAKAADRKIIGKASATERDPSSSEKFSCWLLPEEILNPGYR